MAIQIKGQCIRARYENTKEVQQWLFELGYEWRTGKEISFLESRWVFTNRDGSLTHEPAVKYPGTVELSFIPVGFERKKFRGLRADVLIIDDLAQAVHEPAHEPHPYQPIIDELTKAKTEGWEKAVSWLGNVSLEKVKSMKLRHHRGNTRLFSAFIWSNTPQRHRFWSEQNKGIRGL